MGEHTLFMVIQYRGSNLGVYVWEASTLSTELHSQFYIGPTPDSNCVLQSTLGRQRGKKSRMLPDSSPSPSQEPQTIENIYSLHEQGSVTQSAKRHGETKRDTGNVLNSLCLTRREPSSGQSLEPALLSTCPTNPSPSPTLWVKT